MTRLTGKQMYRELGKLIEDIRHDVNKLSDEHETLQRQERRALEGRKANLHTIASGFANIFLNGHPIEFSESIRLAIQARDDLSKGIRRELEGTALEQEAECSRVFGVAEDARRKAEQAYFEEMAADPAYQASKAKAESVEDEVRKLNEKIRDMHAECSSKINGFMRDKHFRHLFDRGYGTPKYRGLLFFAWMDKWLANRINYDDSLKDYALLREMPTYSNDLIQAYQDKLESLKKECSAFIDELKKKHDLKRVQARRNVAYQAMQAARDKIKTLQKSLAQIEDREDAHFNGIVRMIEQEIADYSKADFVKMTREIGDMRLTRSAVDEYLGSFDEVKKIRLSVLTADESARLAKLKLETAIKNRERFSRDGYDSSRWVFDSNGFDDGFLLGYLTGSISSETLKGYGHKTQELSTYDTYGSSRDSGSSWGSSGSFGGSSSSSSSSSWSSSDSFGDDSSTHRTSDSF